VLRLAATAVCVLAAGCGGGGDGGGDGDARAQVGAVINRLGEASRDGDGRRICGELFTENLRISVDRASGGSCVDEVRRNVADPDAAYTLEKLEVNGDSAIGEVVDQRKRRSTLVLQRDGGSWRIARIGSLRS
jgi:hypothetical protein